MSSSEADREEGRLLLRKAREDERALSRFASDPEIADAVIGFHAQQAVEKSLKAALAASGVEFPWTHDIRHLLERLDDAGVSVPTGVRDGRTLTPWAVEFRYGETIEDELDRDTTVQLVARVVDWAAAVVDADGGPLGTATG